MSQQFRFALVNGHLSTTFVYVQRVNHALSFQICNDKIMKMHLFMFKLLVNQMLVKTNCLALTFKIVAS